MLERNFEVEEVLELLEQKKFNELKKYLERINGADFPSIFEAVDDKDMIIIFRLLNKEEAAEIFAELDADLQEKLINSFSDKELKYVVDNLFIDDTVDMIEEMPELSDLYGYRVIGISGTGLSWIYALNHLALNVSGFKDYELKAIEARMEQVSDTYTAISKDMGNVFLRKLMCPKTLHLINRWDIWDIDDRIIDFNYGLDINGPEDLLRVFESEEIDYQTQAKAINDGVKICRYVQKEDKEPALRDRRDRRARWCRTVPLQPRRHIYRTFIREVSGSCRQGSYNVRHKNRQLQIGEKLRQGARPRERIPNNGAQRAAALRTDGDRRITAATPCNTGTAAGPL